MSRNLSIIIIFIALLPVIIYIFVQPISDTDQELHILKNDKEIVLEYSYNILHDYFYQQNTSEIKIPHLQDDNIPYNILFITLLNNGSVRACQSGSTQKDNSNRLFLDIQEAVIECINDARFGGAIQKEELSQIDIMFTFLYDVKWVSNTSFVFLQNNIELGIHSLEILFNDTPVIFKESVPISHNYDLEYTLDRLCYKANLKKDCYLDDDIDLFRYETLTFMGNRTLDIVDLYRYNILIDQNDVTNEMIYDSVNSGYHWFLHNINMENNLLEYEYYPSENSYSTENNHVRQLASLWALTELNNFLLNITSNDIIIHSLDYYIQFMNHSGNFTYLTINNRSKLANNAFLLMALINTPEYENRSDYIEKLSNGILSLQQDNGSFHTYFFSDKNTGIDYYPGEAMLSLMKMYNHTKDQRYLTSVEKAFYHYRDYWRDNKSTAFIPWHSQTYKLLFEVTKDSDVAEFIFEMNDWIIDNYQIKNSAYQDEIGGFPRYYPTFSTSVFIEGINDAHSIALMVNDTYHMQKYEKAIKLGVRFILQIQFTENNTFYLKNPKRAIGGFKASLTCNNLRIDNTQHSVMALMKTYDNKIFNRNKMEK